tara:strand:+ start:381 stop:686 length:306 start_codon:yes stop_codon:yes gene_type:complete
MWALHRDGDSKNNTIGNLYWGTPTQNCEDRKKHIGGYSGEANPNSKLSSEQVGYIRKLYRAGGVRQQDLALAFSVKQAHISAIVTGKVWSGNDHLGKGMKS